MVSKYIVEVLLSIFEKHDGKKYQPQKGKNLTAVTQALQHKHNKNILYY